MNILHLLLGLIITLMNLIDSINKTSNALDVFSTELIATWIITLLMIAGFIFSVINTNCIKNIINDLRRYDDSNNIHFVNNEKIRNHIVNSFNRGLPEDVDIEFSEDNIHKLTLSGLQPVVSNTFTALGVLGTFIGLTTGLGNLGNTTTEIISGIDGLIPGIKTAFSTSIFGLMYSTLYNFTFKNLQLELYSEISKLKKKFKRIDIGNADSLDGLVSVLNQFCRQSTELIDAINKKAINAESIVADAEMKLANALYNFDTVITEKLKEYNNLLRSQNETYLQNSYKVLNEYRDTMIRSLQSQFNSHKIDLQGWMEVLDNHRKEFSDTIIKIEEKEASIVDRIDKLCLSTDMNYKNIMQIDSKLSDTVGKLSESTSSLKTSLDNSTTVVRDNLSSISKSISESSIICKETSDTVDKQIKVIDNTNRQIKENNETLNKYIANIDSSVNKLDMKLQNIVKQTGDRIEQMADTKTKQVSIDIEKIVTQEAKSIEEVYKLMNSIGSSLIKYESAIKESESKADKTLENIESSKLNAELLNKDLASINKHLIKLDELMEKIEKDEK